MAYNLAHMYLNFGSSEYALKFFDCAKQWVQEFLESKQIDDLDIHSSFLAVLDVDKSLAEAMLYGSKAQKAVLETMEQACKSFIHFQWVKTPAYAHCLANTVSINRKLLVTGPSSQLTNIELLKDAEKILVPFQNYYLIEWSLTKLLLGMELQMANQNYRASFECLEEGILVLEKKQGAHVILKEFYFYLAKAAFNLGLYAKARYYFNKLEHVPYETKEDLLLDVVNWLQLNGLLGFVTRDHLSAIIHPEGNMLALKDEVTLHHFRKSIPEKEKKSILQAFEETQALLDETTELPVKEALAARVLIAYCLGKLEKAKEYFTQLTALLADDETEIFLQPFTLITFVSFHLRPMIHKLETLLDEYHRQTKPLGDLNKRTLYHAMMIVYHVETCQLQTVWVTFRSSRK